MRIGVPKEIRPHEYRVGMTPAGVELLTREGNEVFVQQDAGAGIGFGDDDYRRAGASVLLTADEVWAAGDLLVKIKKPIAVEYPRMRRGQCIISFLHIWDGPSCLEALHEQGASSVSMEEVRNHDGELVLLTPMSQISGRASIQIAAGLLMRRGGEGAPFGVGGLGTCVGGVDGADPANVVVIGGGAAGGAAARHASALGANVTVLDIEPARVRRELGELPGCHVLPSNQVELADALRNADVVIGAVRIRGQYPPQAPIVVTTEMVGRMKDRAVLIDLSIDHGGCFEDSRMTSHEDPAYEAHGKIFSCIPNIPTGVPLTATQAITRVTLPIVSKIAALGLREAARTDPVIASGINTVDGTLVRVEVSERHGHPAVPLRRLLEG